MKSDIEKAKNYAFLLLKFRLRSEKEIYERLKKKKFSEEIIKQTLAYLKDKRFIDDACFTEAWIESRIKKPLGLRKLKEELRLKGISKELINDKIENIKALYSEENIVAQIAKDRLSKLKGIEPQKARRRIYAYLLRRGFSPDVVIDALSNF